jgi:glycine betaine/proline transport system permease protein
MSDFPEWLVIPFADWVEAIFKWVQDTLGGFFDVVNDLVLTGALGTVSRAVDVAGYTWKILPVVWWTYLILALAGLLVAAATLITWRRTHKIKLTILLTATLVIITYISLFGLLGIESFLLWIAWFVVVILVGFAAWRIIGKWWAGLLVAAGLIIIGSFRFKSVGYWDLAMETMAIIIISVIIALAIGIPTGILMARNDRIESIFKPQLDAMQTMPSFVYLVPVLLLFSMGKVPAVFATIIYSVPPVIRLTNTGIRQVSQSVIEAARAFGSSTRQTLLEVQLPLAIPSIIVGINQTTMMALAMVVIASMVGARGLGMEVLMAINTVDVGRGFQAGLSIVILAIIIDRLTGAMAARQQRETKTYD